MTTGSALSSDNRQLVGPALRAFFRIAGKWNLSADEERCLLGLPARSTYYRWRREHCGRLSSDAMERISCVIGIYGALHTMFPDDKQADSWIRRPNAAALFSGQTALHFMMGGQVNGLRAVRLYLDGQVESDLSLQPDARYS